MNRHIMLYLALWAYRTVVKTTTSFSPYQLIHGVESVLPVKSDGETIMHFVFNQIITRFDIPKELVTDHGRHFQNKMMEDLASKLG